METTNNTELTTAGSNGQLDGLVGLCERIGTFVYRVSESYHYSDESGTYEYGTYTSLEKARARMNAVWEQKKYGEKDMKYSSDLRILGAGYDSPKIGIDAIELDKDTEYDDCGYT